MIADRFTGFAERYQSHFRSKTRSFFAGAASYLKGLMQAEDKNMERMGEVVAGCNDQQLQHMLTHAKWDHDAVMKQVICLEDPQPMAPEPHKGRGRTRRHPWTLATPMRVDAWAREQLPEA